MRERGAQKLTPGGRRMGPKNPPTAPIAVPEGK